jgi:VanZ family protein
MTGIIALESTKYLGADHTSGPLRFIYQALFGHVSDARWEVIHHYTRKCGHFLGYGMVGLSWLRAWQRTRPEGTFVRSAVLAMLFTAITASADEFHQSFLPNRTASIWDVLIDCSGALVLQLLAFAVSRFRGPRQIARAA